MTASRKGRLQLLAVVTVFLAPLLAAIYLNSAWTSWKPQAMVNQGALLTPVIALPEHLRARLDARSRWLIMQVVAKCDESCETTHRELENVRRATGRHQGDIVVRDIVADPTWKATLPADHGIYLGDPRGNLILHYGPDHTMSDLLNDLDRLLRYSKEGGDEG